MLPNFVIIGAQKSASTFVQGCLKEHPEIYIPNGEIAFFESPHYEENSIVSLERLFEGRNEKCLGIKRPNYIGTSEVPNRIKNHLPNAKLIAVLRNPIERAVSAYHHYINYGFIPPRDIERGMLDLLNGSYSVKFKRSKEIIEFGFYYKHLKEYRHFLEREQLLVLLHEDIVKSPLSSVKRIYRFLDIDAKYEPKAIDSRPQAVTYSIPHLILSSIRNRLFYNYNSDRTRLFVKDLNPINKAIAGFITLIGKQLLSKIFINTRPTLSEQLKDRLFNVYEDDIKKLQLLIQRNLCQWLSL